MANSVDPDHTTRYLAPDLALHGLLRQILMVTIVLDQSRVKVTQVIKGKILSKLGIFRFNGPVIFSKYQFC